MTNDAAVDIRERLRSQDPGSVAGALLEISRQDLKEFVYEVQRALMDPASTVRAAAVQVLCSDWRLPECEGTAHNIALADVDDAVRVNALGAALSRRRSTEAISIT